MFTQNRNGDLALPTFIRIMSNPILPPFAPAPAPSAVDEMPSSFLAPGPKLLEFKAKRNDVVYITGALMRCDMKFEKSFFLKPELCADETVRKGLKGFMASARKEPLVLRVRSKIAYDVGKLMFPLLPSQGVGSKASVRASIEDKFFASAGAAASLGRLNQYYPGPNDKIALAPTKVEAMEALRRCGLDRSGELPHNLRPFPLLHVEGVDNIGANPKADNGFPVLKKFSDDFARELVYKIAQSMRAELDRARTHPGGIAAWKEAAEEQRPYLVALQGKTKSDYYSTKKLQELQLRFYNVFPKQVILNMQIATQPFERLAKNISHGPEFRSVIGSSLYQGGADALVDALEDQLRESEMAYLHCGDDSFVAVKGVSITGAPVIYLFALDCSSFDLTQHRDATLQIHEALRQELGRFDKTAADLWFEFARSRLVVTAGTLVMKWRHGGPSGMPLQSKVNDMLMEVFLARLKKAVEGHLTSVRDEEWWNVMIQKKGKELGLVVRVEQFSMIAASTVREALRITPFLFIGYYFHMRGDRVAPCTDVPRTMAQMPYPSQRWEGKDEDFAVREAIRLGSMYMSAGVPTLALEPAFEAWRLEVVKLLRKTLDEKGDMASDKLAWALGQGVFGPNIARSLSGLLRVLEDGTEAGWMKPPAPLPGSSTMIAIGAPLPGESWADAVDREEAATSLLTIPRALRQPGFVRLPITPVTTHPATLKNAGRPPPTAIWGPPKPKLGGLAGARTEGKSRAPKHDKSQSKDKRSGHVYDSSDDGYTSGYEGYEEYEDLDEMD